MFRSWIYPIYLKLPKCLNYLSPLEDPRLFLVM